MSDEAPFDYPTVVFGFMNGPIRYETNGQGVRDWFPEPEATWFRFLRNVGPRQIAPEGKTYAVTHMQKKSTLGFLLMKPFCFYFWIMPGPQKQDAEGNWLEGTEKGASGRTPGKRWDAGQSCYIDTNGRFAENWD